MTVATPSCTDARRHAEQAVGAGALAAAIAGDVAGQAQLPAPERDRRAEVADRGRIEAGGQRMSRAAARGTEKSAKWPSNKATLSPPSRRAGDVIAEQVAGEWRQPHPHPARHGPAIGADQSVELARASRSVTPGVSTRQLPSAPRLVASAAATDERQKPQAGASVGKREIGDERLALAA